MASSTTHLIELIINATNNAGAGFAAARRDAEKFNDLIKQGQKDTDRSAEAQARLQDSIEKSNKRMKEQNDSLGENIHLTEKDAAAKATLTKAIKDQAAEIADGKATEDSLFLAQQTRDQAEAGLAESRRKRRATEIRGEEAFVARFGEIGAKQNTMRLEAASRDAATEVQASSRRNDIRKKEIAAEFQHVKTIDQILKKAQSGNFSGVNGARAAYKKIRTSLEEAGFDKIDVSGSNATFLRTLKNARATAARRRTGAETGTLSTLAEPGVSLQEIEKEVGARKQAQRKIESQLAIARDSRRRLSQDEQIFIQDIIDKEEERAALEIERFSMEQEHQSLLIEGEKERNKALYEGESILNEREKKEAARQAARRTRAAEDRKAGLETQRNIKNEQRSLADQQVQREKILVEIEKISRASAENGRLSSKENAKAREEIKRLKEDYIAFGGDVKDIYTTLRSPTVKKLISEDQNKEFQKSIENLKKQTEEFEKASSRKNKTEKINREGLTRFEKQKIEVDVLGFANQAAAAKVAAEAELGNIEAHIKLYGASPAEIALVKAQKALLKSDVKYSVKPETDRNLTRQARKALQREETPIGAVFSAIGKGFNDSSAKLGRFSSQFRGLLILGLVAFLGQLASGVLVLAGALTALVSSALSAAGALGGALVAGIGQALPAVGVLAAFGNRLQKVFGALKQSNLEQQQASYSGAKAADTQAKSLSGVADAQKALTDARKTAKKTLEDLIFAEKGQALSAEEAGFALQKAISSGGSMGVARAQLGVESANRDLAGTRSDISSRKKSGIEGSPEVVAALKNLEQAKQSSAQAGTDVTAAAGKLNFLLAGLSASEVRLYKALMRLQTAWRKFASSITAPLTDSFTFAVNRVVKILDSKQILDAGKKLSTALGSSFTQIFDALFSKEYVSRFLALGEELAKNLKPITNIVINLLNIFQNFAEAGSPALSLILKYLDDIIGSLNRWSSSIAGKKSLTDFFTQGSGSLKGILDLFIAIGNVILAIMGPGGGIAAGNDIIGQMTRGLNNFAEAIKTPSSRVKKFFDDFFYAGRQTLPILKPLLSALGGLIEKLVSKKAIDSLSNLGNIITKVIVPALDKFIWLMQYIVNGFEAVVAVPLVSTILSVVLSLGLLKAVLMRFSPLWHGITNAKGPIQDLAKSIGETTAAQNALNAAMAKEKFYGVAGPEGLIGPPTARGARDAQGLPPILPGGKPKQMLRKTPVVGKLLMGAGALGGPEAMASMGIEGSAIASAGEMLAPFASVAAVVAVIVAAIVGLLALSGKLDDVWKAIQETFNGVFNAIKKSLGELAMAATGKKSMKEAFSSVVDVLKLLGRILAAVLIPAIKIVGTTIGFAIIAPIKILTAIIEALRGIIAGIVEYAKGTFNLIAGFFKGIFTGDWSQVEKGFSQILDGLKGIALSFANGLLGILSSPFRALADLVDSIFDSGNKRAKSLEDQLNKAKMKPGDSRVFSGAKDKVPEGYSIKTVGVGKGAVTIITKDKAGASQDVNVTDANKNSDTSSRDLSKGQQRSNRKSPAKPKAATKADNADATSFLNTFDPQTVQLSDAIVKKLSRYWRVLRQAAKDSINDVIDFLKDLRGAKGNGRIDKFVTSAISDFKRLRTGVRTNMQGISNIVENQMQNSMKAVHDAAVYMKNTLQKALKDVGAESISISVAAPPKVTGNGAQGHATGGWVGNRGERGQDAVHTILGRGEAVLNWGQQKVVEPALRKVYGFGLDEMFGRTRGTHAGAGGPTRGFARGGRAGIGRGGRDVVATVFGSEGDFYDPYDAQDSNTAAGKGYRGDNMRAIQWVFGEIGDSALGHLARGYKLKVSRAGKSAILGKYDINDGTGAGSRAMDIWIHAARYLNNFQKVGMGTVHIEPVSQSTPLGPTDGSGGGGDPATLKMPKITGGNSPVGKFVTKGTKKMVDGAQKYLDRHTPTISGSGGGGAIAPVGSDSGGTTVVDGKPVANWIATILMAARKAGVAFGVSSGFRSFAEQSRLWDQLGHDTSIVARPGTSNHEGATWPRGAVDISPGWNNLEAWLRSHPQYGRSLHHYGNPRDPYHFSARGNAEGGFVGLRKFANGGRVDGREGQPVPIVAHAGEWVVNKMQQAKIAMMAGTTTDKVKGALGFAGGPAYFKDGGVIERNPSGSIRTVNKNGSLNVLELPELNIQSYFTSFQSAFDKAFKFIDRQIKTLSSSSRIERQIKAAEKRIERLKKGDESDKQQKVIDKLEERVKTLNEKLLKKDIDTLLKSIRKLTAEDGVFSQLAQKITTQFDRATTAAQLAAVGLTKIGTKLKKLTTGAAFEKAINPEEIANKEAALQALLSERLQSLRTDWVRTLSRVNSIIKKTKLAKTEKITKTLAGLNADVQSIQRKIDKAEEGDESEAEKKRIERLKKSLKAKKEQIKNQENNLKKRRELDAEVIQAEDKIAEIEKQIIDAETAKLEALKTAFEEGTKAVTKSQDAALKQAAFVKSAGEIISSFGGSILGRTGQELITKSLADNKKAAIEKREALKDRLAEAKKLAASDPRFQSLVDDLSDQLNESILAVLQATADEGANAIAVLQKGVEDKIKAIDVAAALENVNKSIGELIGNNGMVSNALNASLESAKKRQSALAAALAEAEAQDQRDPRWKELTDSLKQQLADAGLSIYEANAAIIQNAIDATDKVFQRGEFIRGISERGAALAERMGNRSGAFATRQGNLAGKGADLQSQRDSLQALLSSPELVGNTKQLEELQNKIAELDMSIAENTQETKDLSLEYRKSQVDLITGRSDRTTGLLGSVGGIIANIAKATGSSQSLESQIGLAEQIKTALGLEQGGLADQISKAIADQQLGSEANAVLTQLQTAFSSGDPASFAATLAALSPTISELESTLGVTAAGTFQTLINAMISNTTATTDNTANLAELNGLANQPQQFATTAWTKFRTALFNGVGDILPQFQIPQMATGGAITKGGLFQLHPGEFVVNATQSNLPSDSPINITVNEANKPLDVTALASRIAFEKRTRR